MKPSERKTFAAVATQASALAADMRAFNAKNRSRAAVDDLSAAVRAKPLTDVQIFDLLPNLQSGWTLTTYGLWVARAIERAHGIGATVVCGPSELHPPCAVCAKPPSEHGSYPTCATHPYTADGTCQYVLGAACFGAECMGGCVCARGMNEVPRG